MPLSEPRNRLVLVIDSTTVNGIDFVELKSIDATTLYVHFLNSVDVKTPSIKASISGGDRIQGITLAPIDNTTDWTVDAEGRPILALHASEAGDFSNYTITITGAPLDPMYSSTTFSFKVLCPSQFDCQTTPECCTAPEPPLPAIDYLAKDFLSFKQALSDFSSQRYPSWVERSEADFCVMFMETLSAVADELSYMQDRVAAEATLLNATQRRSLTSLARLVDYEPTPITSGTTTVQCNVTGNTVPAGTLVTATRPDGLVVPYEIGTGLADTTKYQTSQLWNDGIQPYWFDDSQQCLPCGSTSMWVLGHGYNFTSVPNNSLLIQTDLPGESVREVFQIVSAFEIFDEIFLTSNNPTPVTYITWSPAQATTRDHDLTKTHLAGNLLPATQGQRFNESFVVGTAPAGLTSLPVAVARWGPNGTANQPNWVFRYPLLRTMGASSLGASAVAALSIITTGAQPRLTWLPPALDAQGNPVVDPDIAKPQPEIMLNRRLPEPQAFQFATSLLDATATEYAYTIDPAAWRPVPTQNAPSQWEYDSDQGDTLRFGDGTFGNPPSDGDVFDVLYRIGLGASGNVAADAINAVAPTSTAYVSSVRNPFPVTSGADAETAQHIQRMAPQAFRALQYRAVQPIDYETAAESLSFVLAAGTSFRWTGSWLTVFTTVDPKAGSSGGATVTEDEEIELIELLNRRRLAGYESYVPPPTLVSIDLQITVCVTTGWLDSNVEEAVLQALADTQNRDGARGFFYADSFTFGTPLYRSALEAAIQSVPGVKGVLDVQYRQRGSSNTYTELPPILTFGPNQILRVANDPDFPERGTIRVTAEGGR